MGKVKDGAPGIDNVRISYIRLAGKTTQEAVCNVIMDMVNKDPCEWEEMVKVGLVVPLFKKVNGMTSITIGGFAFLAWQVGYWQGLWHQGQGSGQRQ